MAKHESLPGAIPVKKTGAFDIAGQPSDVRKAKSPPAKMRFNASAMLRTTMKLAALTLTSKNAIASVNAQTAYSQRTDPPTLDKLQQCDPHQLEQFKTQLISQDAYASDLAMLCIDERTYKRYKAERTAESRTNCYGDAIGMTGRLNPSGVMHGEPFSCNALVDGALKDGAVHAQNNACPDFTRQMQFFISEDRRDYHVISRGPLDETWMNKFSGSPRFPVSIFGATAPQLSGGGITWIVRDLQGEVRVERQRPRDYPNWCPEMLCSLPEKSASPKYDL